MLKLVTLTLIPLTPERVLPYCTPGYSVLVMGNASIHHLPRIAELCLEWAVDLEYLPLYSPDYNPIEKGIKVLRSWMKKIWKLVEEFEDFQYFLYYAIEQACCTDLDARGWFRMCGYPVRG